MLRGSVAKASTPEEFDKFVRAEVAKIGKAIKDGGIKLQLNHSFTNHPSRITRKQ